MFHAHCAVAAAGVVADDGGAAWFGPALSAAALDRTLEARLAPAVTAGLAPVHFGWTTLKTRLKNIDAGICNTEARQRNSVAEIADPRHPIQNAERIAAPNFLGWCH